jgi:hypothetical protein
MKKSDISPIPPFFDRYINQVEENDLMNALIKSQEALNALPVQQLEAIGRKVYAPGKWTVHDILQHIIDNERVQSYRALRLARRDQTPLPGYDENDFATAALASYRSITDLVEELKTLRLSTMQLFKSIPSANLTCNGLCNNVMLSPLALGFVITGHQQHHFRVIREKYYPLIHSA